VSKIEIFLKSKVLSSALWLIIIIFCNTSFINAQSQFSIGPTVGVNYATFHGKDVEQIGIASPSAGPYIGVFFNYRFAKLFAIQPEIAFTKKGSIVTSYFFGDYTYIENDIEVPILLKFYFPSNGKVKPSLFAGPAFAFNTSSKVVTNDGPESGTILFSNFAKIFDFGLAFGGELGFLIGKGILDFSLRYTLGLTAIYDPEEYKITNGVFSIITNYGFSL